MLRETYHPLWKYDEYHFNYFDKALDTYSRNGKVLFASDFNTEITEYCIESVLYDYELSTLVKETACSETCTFDIVYCIPFTKTSPNRSYLLLTIALS